MKPSNEVITEIISKQSKSYAKWNANSLALLIQVDRLMFSYVSHNFNNWSQSPVG